MKRTIVLGALVMGGMLLFSVRAYQQAAGGAGQDAPKVVEVEKLKDNLFMLKGGGGNTAVFVASDGVVVVDTKNPGWGQPILTRIKELTSKPITMIINTHTHGDHVSGNVEFPTNIEIVTHENTKANMEKMIGAFGIAQPTPPPPNIFKVNNGRGMPTRTYKTTMTLGKGPDEIDLYYFGRGHTNGDTFVVFKELRVMHAGDVFSGKNLPLLDSNNGGSGVAIADTLEKAANVKAVDLYITGHSTVMTPADLKEYIQFNREFLADVRAAKKAGRSIDEVANSWKLPDKYKGYTIAPARLKTNVQVITDELK
jgi:cyclase